MLWSVQYNDNKLNNKGDYVKNLIQIQLDENTVIYIEASNEHTTSADDDVFIPASSQRHIINKASDYFNKSLDKIKRVCSSISNSFIDIDNPPNEFEISFSVKFGADAGIIISSVSAEATFNVKMKWGKERE